MFKVGQLARVREDHLDEQLYVFSEPDEIIDQTIALGRDVLSALCLPNPDKEIADFLVCLKDGTIVKVYFCTSEVDVIE